MISKNVLSISVIMPVYNGALYLKEAVDSILNQSFEDFEFIIVNDGSADNSAEIIESYNDNRIHFLNYTENKGYTNRLNEGLKISRGKYIARMDSDDISTQDRFQKQFNFLEKHPDISVCGSFIRFIGNETKYKNWVLDTDHEALKLGLLFNNVFCHPSVMLRKSVLDENQLAYNINFEPAEDYELWVRISCISKIYNLPEVLLFYRAGDHQISQKQNSKQQIQKHTIIKKQLMMLNLNATSVQLDIHLRLYFKTIVITADYMPKIINWAKLLIDANNKEQIYHQVKFEKFINKLVDENRDEFNRLLTELSLKDFLKFKIKTLIGWQSFKPSSTLTQNENSIHFI